MLDQVEGCNLTSNLWMSNQADTCMYKCTWTCINRKMGFMVTTSVEIDTF